MWFILRRSLNRTGGEKVTQQRDLHFTDVDSNKEDTTSDDDNSQRACSLSDAVSTFSELQQDDHVLQRQHSDVSHHGDHINSPSSAHHHQEVSRLQQLLLVIITLTGTVDWHLAVVLAIRVR